ncbi:alpha/beta fold hydrolase [Chitinophaga qingshengii]|uniref:Alpha/beta hydrolase n=1 Tax=Chitinophaga qingshengii TaxID=1569794 RepID=A0ABR7TN11_9BACT|nr:alpha/beta hydrolase [Chitinophaga qingshengii]MBC9930896.1 alpha/beta hydrolase [Chitinophaga qingshengii]
MKWRIIVIMICFPVSYLYSQTKSIAINNLKMAYKTFGLETRKANEPVIVFESGLGSGGGNFEPLFPHLPKNITGFIYDRNGLRESAIDTTVKTDADVVKRLHDLLSALKIAPPYILIGHSIGGAFIRLYAANYPAEVSGLLFIDPTDFMLTKEEDLQVKKSTSSVTGYQDIWTINLTGMLKDTAMPVGMRHEFKRASAESTPTFFKNYTSLPPLKDIPVTVLIAYNKRIEPYETEMNAKLKLGINIKPWWAALDRLRITHYATLIKDNHDSRLVLLPGYSHGIHHQDPKLVADAIVDVYERCVK